MKSFILTFVYLICYTLISQQCQAETYGLGVSVQNSDLTIYLPVDLDSGYRIEGYLSRVEDEYQNDPNYKSEYEVNIYGIGFFKFYRSAKHAFLYGMRLGTRNYDSKSYSTYFYGSSNILSANNDNHKAYSVAPGIGFEYSISKKMTISGEVSYVYEKVDGKVSSINIDSFGTNYTESNYDETRQNTESRLILRYFF